MFVFHKHLSRFTFDHYFCLYLLLVFSFIYLPSLRPSSLLLWLPFHPHLSHPSPYPLKESTSTSTESLMFASALSHVQATPLLWTSSTWTIKFCSSCASSITSFIIFPASSLPTIYHTLILTPYTFYIFSPRPPPHPLFALLLLLPLSPLITIPTFIRLPHMHLSHSYVKPQSSHGRRFTYILSPSAEILANPWACAILQPSILLSFSPSILLSSPFFLYASSLFDLFSSLFPYFFSFLLG